MAEQRQSNHIVAPVIRLGRKRALGIGVGLMLLSATQLQCGKSQAPTVEAMQGEQARALPLTFVSLEGRRDGAIVNARVVFAGPGNSDRLDIELEIDLGPPIHLAAGKFRMKQSGILLAGSVEPLALDFQGGQSGGMSLGGRFLLRRDDGAIAYRVNLPAEVIHESRYE